MKKENMTIKHRSPAGNDTESIPPAHINYTLKVVESLHFFAHVTVSQSFEPDGGMLFEEIIDHLHHYPWDAHMDSYLFARFHDLKSWPDEQVECLITRFRRKPLSYWYLILNWLAYNKVKKAQAFIADFESDLTDASGIHDNMCLAEIMQMSHPLRKDLGKAYRLFKENILEHKRLAVEETKILRDVAQRLGYRSDGKYIHIRHVEPAGQAGIPSHEVGTGLRSLTPEQTIEWLETVPGVPAIVRGRVMLKTGTESIVSCGGNQTIRIRTSLPPHKTFVTCDLRYVGKGVGHYLSSISMAMEYSERLSAYTGCRPDWPMCYEHDMKLMRSSYRKLAESGMRGLDPMTLNSYPLIQESGLIHDMELYWVLGEAVTDQGIEQIYIPAQLVFYMTNFDEPKLEADHSANGLASGTNIREAKRQGLLEIFERHGFYTTCFDSGRCFVLETDIPEIQSVLESDELNKRGITIQFMDISTRFGIPNYKAFVEIDGRLIVGFGADLNSKIAITRALGELLPNIFTFENEHGPITASRLGEPVKRTLRLKNLPPRSFDMAEDTLLPNYSTGNVEADLDLLEGLLLGNRLRPMYVNLTLRRLGVPVVRVIVPGLDVPTTFTERHYESLIDAIDKSSPC
ncbi:YcaO-like family protein [Thermodesulfobacteriota bacterium]